MKHNPIDLIRHFDLQAHPEGGFFKEVYRCSEEISDLELMQNYSGRRNLATSIYFLLTGNQVSKLHQLKSDEIWYFHFGSALLVHVFYQNNYRVYTLGIDITKGEEPQLLLPAGSIFGAEVVDKKSFSFMSCMVTPGFHFDDFTLLSFDEVIDQFPQCSSVIKRLT